MTLRNAAPALDDLAPGRASERVHSLAGALALDAPRPRGGCERELLDAAAGLKALATGGALDLAARGRALKCASQP